MVPLVIGAIAGAGMGMLSTFLSSQKEQKQIREQQQLAKDAYGHKREYDAGVWGLQRNAALKGLNLQKNRLAQAYNVDMTGFNTGLEGQALQNQAAQISLSDNKGMALSDQGASGIRGNDALQQRIDFEEGQFQRQLALQERGTSLGLNNMAAQYSTSFDDIGREIDSWGSGGYRSRAKTLSDTYADQIFGLEMEGYNRAIRDAKAGPLDYLTGMFSGAGFGASVGMSVGNMGGQMQIPVNAVTKVVNAKKANIFSAL